MPGCSCKRYYQNTKTIRTGYFGIINDSMYYPFPFLREICLIDRRKYQWDGEKASNIWHTEGALASSGGGGTIFHLFPFPSQRKNPGLPKRRRRQHHQTNFFSKEDSSFLEQGENSGNIIKKRQRRRDTRRIPLSASFSSFSHLQIQEKGIRKLDLFCFLCECGKRKDVRILFLPSLSTPARTHSEKEEEEEECVLALA